MSESGPSQMAETVHKGADISECGRYRYALTRTWEIGSRLTFVMLNPSTADAAVDDPTIRRCVGFARREGFSGLRVLNLYGFRATKPADLLTCDDAVGPDNDDYLRTYLGHVWKWEEFAVAAWGANARAERVRQVLDLVPGLDWRCLGTTKDGHPKHPLYIAGDQPLVPFGKGSS